MVYSNKATIIPQVVVDPGDEGTVSIAQTERAGTVFVVGNFRTDKVDLEAYTNFKTASEAMDEVSPGWTVNDPGSADWNNDLIKFYFARTLSKDAKTINGVKNITEVSSGAEAVIFVNTAKIEPIKQEVSALTTADFLAGQVDIDGEIIPIEDYIQDLINSIKSENFDILSLCHEFADEPLNPSANIADQVSLIEKIKIFADDQYHRQNLFGLVFPLIAYDPDATDINKRYPLPADYTEKEILQLENALDKFGTPGVIGLNGKKLSTNQSGGLYIASVQAAFAADDINDYVAVKEGPAFTPGAAWSSKEIAAYYTGLIAGRNISEPITALKLGALKGIMKNQILDYKAPTIIDEVEQPDAGFGYRLTQAGALTIRSGSRAKKDVFVVNNLAPRDKTEDTTTQFNACHYRTRNGLINQLELQNFLGKKKLLGAQADLEHEVTDKLATAVANETIADYKINVKNDPYFADVVDLTIRLDMINIISKIQIYVTMSLDSQTLGA